MMQQIYCTTGKHKLELIFAEPCKDCEIERLRAQLFEARNQVDHLHDILRAETSADAGNQKP
jgi:hypothetical protein